MRNNGHNIFTSALNAFTGQGDWIDYLMANNNEELTFNQLAAMTFNTGLNSLNRVGQGARFWLKEAGMSDKNINLVASILSPITAMERIGKDL
jgi:hypothetical protein